MQNKELTIYYFSGTGNARRVAEWFGEFAEKKEYNTEIIDIAQIDRKKIAPPKENTIIGFCSPTHGFNFPPIMMHFILRFPRARNNKAFIINIKISIII